MILYCPDITPRLLYIVDFFGQELFDHSIRVTSDTGEFAREAGPRINYSEHDFPGAFSLHPVPLLFQSGIHPIPIECFTSNDNKAFFSTVGDYSFDIFAAAFYLLSRYEEYLPHEKDSYGRFPHTRSLAWKEGFLDQPLINFWLRDFRAALSRHYPDMPFRPPGFKFIPTYDIDSAWSWLHKPWWVNIGGTIKAIATGKWIQAGKRISVLRGKEKDPYDVYEWLDSLHLYCRMRPYYFFLVAARRKGVDKNTPREDPGLRELIRYHAIGSRLGVHPSWQSGDKEDLLKQEVEWLRAVSGQSITRSRQHYIRFTLPVSYRRLLQNGIEQDFSMGYGSINGFRASVASSFHWYDLQKEEKTRLRIFPFCFMDGNAYYEQNNSVGQTINELMHYYHQIHKTGGLMITIWHNSILGSDPEFAGWRELYETFLKEEVYWDM